MSHRFNQPQLPESSKSGIAMHTPRLPTGILVLKEVGGNSCVGLRLRRIHRHPESRAAYGGDAPDQRACNANWEKAELLFQRIVPVTCTGSCVPKGLLTQESMSSFS